MLLFGVVAVRAKVSARRPASSGVNKVLLERRRIVILGQATPCCWRERGKWVALLPANVRADDDGATKQRGKILRDRNALFILYTWYKYSADFTKRLPDDW